MKNLNKAAGILAVGALSLTFGGCSMFKAPQPPEMTLADACTLFTVNSQADKAAAWGAQRFKILPGDMIKIKESCANEGQFDYYRGANTIHMDLEHR